MGRWSLIAGFEPMFAVDHMYIEANIHVCKSVQIKSTHILHRTCGSAAVKYPP